MKSSSILLLLTLSLTIVLNTSNRTNMYTLPAYVGIILRQDNQILLVKRINTDWASERWNFPGGLLENGETLLQAAVRETKEETGVIVDPQNFTRLYVEYMYKRVALIRVPLSAFTS